MDPDDIHYTTLKGVLFVARKNDLAFTVQNRGEIDRAESFVQEKAVAHTDSGILHIL